MVLPVGLSGLGVVLNRREDADASVAQTTSSAAGPSEEVDGARSEHAVILALKECQCTSTPGRLTENG